MQYKTITYLNILQLNTKLQHPEGHIELTKMLPNYEIDLIYNTSKPVLELNMSERLGQPDFDWDEDD